MTSALKIILFSVYPLLTLPWLPQLVLVRSSKMVEGDIKTFQTQSPLTAGDDGVLLSLYLGVLASGKGEGVKIIFCFPFTIAPPEGC